MAETTNGAGKQANAEEAQKISPKHTNGSTVKKLKSSSDRCKWWIGGLGAFLLLFFDKIECPLPRNSIMTIALLGIACLGFASVYYEKEAQDLENLIITKEVNRDGVALDAYTRLNRSDYFYWAGILALLANGVLTIIAGFSLCIEVKKTETRQNPPTVINYFYPDSVRIVRDTIYLAPHQPPCTISRKKILRAPAK